MTSPLLDLRLSVNYANKSGALRDVALTLNGGEILGLVGESGSGKSTLALSIMRLLTGAAGKPQGYIMFDGRDLLGLKSSHMRAIRGREIAMVLQSPIAALNPSLRIGTQMAEAWRAHEPKQSARWREQALASFDLVALSGGAELLDRYPRQLSVGQAQRVLIAMAILHRPRLLIADEPTSALDVITSAEVLALFKKLSRELNIAILFISHDLLSVGALCDRIAILRRGEMVENGPAADVFQNPRCEYTRALLRAMPKYPAPEPAHDLMALSEFMVSGEPANSPAPEPLVRVPD